MKYGRLAGNLGPGKTMKTAYRTTAAYVSGAICGEIRWPVGALCGLPVKFDLDGYGGFEKGARQSFADVLESYLRRNGGDFQNALFAEDSELVIERRLVEAPGRYKVHVRRIPVAKVCPDLVRPDTFASDFFGE